MRICLVYDCLFPHTVGGVERWYRDLAEALVADGNEITYVTLRQWPRARPAVVPGVRVEVVGPRMRLYTPGGRRRILPPLLFGLGVLWHLLRHGRRYDAVHTASFPFFSVLAAAVARRLHRYQLVVDWFEVWSREYWRDYLGPAGRVGWWVQRRCARVDQHAFCFSQIHAGRLREIGGPAGVPRLDGIYAGGLERPKVMPAQPMVMYAGRHIPEKHVPELVHAVALARERVPELRCEIYGDGPEREEVERQIAAVALDGAVQSLGFVELEALEDALRRATCMVLPSVREGKGLIVVEAAAAGTPSVVVRAPDNAAQELIEEGVNGFVASSSAAADLADAIVRVHERGMVLRESTADWFERNARRLSVKTSVAEVTATYRRVAAG